MAQIGVQGVQKVQGVQAVFAVFVLYKDILVSLEARQKPNKPLGEDGGRYPAGVMMWVAENV